MKNNKKVLIVVTILYTLGLSGIITTFAATTPSLGVVATYGVLSSTYTNTIPGTTISGDIGYTTGPAVAPTVSGTTYIANGTYSQAGTDQGTTLAALNWQACTFTFAVGAIDLATDTTHGTVGVYTPGVYCISGAASVGTAGITLEGNGTYIFRVNGALTTVANSAVRLSSASACDVFWTPTQATTLAANTTFAGTVIDAAGITVGANSTWTGLALAFGGTVTTDTTTITVPVCTITPPVVPTPVVVTPTVVNNTGSTSSTGNTTSITPVLTSTTVSTGTVAPVSVVSTGTLAPKITPIVVYEPAPVISPTVVPVITPRLPDTGIAPEWENTSWTIGILVGILTLIWISLIMIQRKKTI